MKHPNDVLGWLESPPPERPEPFAVHTITVTHASGEPDDLHGDSIDYDYELGHGECTIEECSVWFELREGGSLQEVLLGPRYWVGYEAWPWKTTYYVRTWVSKYDIPGEPIEYDQGLYVSTVADEV